MSTSRASASGCVPDRLREASDGQRITVLSRWALDWDNEGKPAAVMAVNTDITERKHAEERQRLLLNELAHRGQNLLTVVWTSSPIQ